MRLWIARPGSWWTYSILLVVLGIGNCLKDILRRSEGQANLHYFRAYSILFSMPSKSFTKRIRITKNGKIVRRPMAVNHFRTRSNAKGIRNKRKTLGLDYPMKKL